MLFLLIVLLSIWGTGSAERHDHFGKFPHIDLFCEYSYRNSFLVKDIPFQYCKNIIYDSVDLDMTSFVGEGDAYLDPLSVQSPPSGKTIESAAKYAKEHPDVRMIATLILRDNSDQIYTDIHYKRLAEVIKQLITKYGFKGFSAQVTIFRPEVRQKVAKALFEVVGDLLLIYDTRARYLALMADTIYPDIIVYFDKILVPSYLPEYGKYQQKTFTIMPQKNPISEEGDLHNTVQYWIGHGYLPEKLIFYYQLKSAFFTLKDMSVGLVGEQFSAMRMEKLNKMCHKINEFTCRSDRLSEYCYKDREAFSYDNNVDVMTKVGFLSGKNVFGIAMKLGQDVMSPNDKTCPLDQHYYIKSAYIVASNS